MRNNQEGVIDILIIAVLFLALLAGGVVVWRLLDSGKELTSTQSTNESIDSDSKQSVGRLTYTNSVYSFSLKYPESLDSYLDNEYQQEGSIWNWGNEDIETLSNGKFMVFFMVEDKAIKTPVDLLSQQWFENQLEHVGYNFRSVSIPEKVEVSNIDGFASATVTNTSLSSGAERHYYTIHNNIFYDFVLIYGDNDMNAKQDAEEILNTLIFS